MPYLPILRPDEVIKAFQKLNWEIAKQMGSYIIITKENSITTLSIPKHPEVARGTLRSLIRKAGSSVEDFLSALN